ncbi:MAG: hypothetical protein M1833_003984 [Piccolia ochrophora]|nr:MAG: hypothetical protein M1833_003984 [Piccolia ochrophora]
MDLDSTSELNLHTVGAGPPLGSTQVLHQMASVDAQIVRPEISARIDKGFFLADKNWTCYRRNYFSVACSYTLKPLMASMPLSLYRSNNMPETIHGFAMSISAVVDGQGGKPVELVQHTPKRDKGPQGKPDRIRLNPHTASSLGGFAGDAAVASAHSEYDQVYAHQTGEAQSFASFERIQFKSATANNGKRRAAQQYYHLVVELYADIGSAAGPEGRWVKVASRLSAPMVVRGRSPGHYQDDRRASSSSNGPSGSSGGDLGGGSGGPSGPTSDSRGLGDSMLPFGGSGGILGGGNGFHTASGLSSLHHSPASINSHPLSSGSSGTSNLEHSVEPLLSSEVSSAMEVSNGYGGYSPCNLQLQSNQRPGHMQPTLSSSSGHHETLSIHQAQFDGDVKPYSGWHNRGYGPREVPAQRHSLNSSVGWQNTSHSPREPSRSNGVYNSCRRIQGAQSLRRYNTDLPAL